MSSQPASALPDGTAPTLPDSTAPTLPASAAPALPALQERLPELMLRDQQRLGRRLDGARRIRKPEARAAVLAEIAGGIDEAELRVAQRRAAVRRSGIRKSFRSARRRTRSSPRYATTRS